MSILFNVDNRPMLAICRSELNKAGTAYIDKYTQKKWIRGYSGTLN